MRTAAAIVLALLSATTLGAQTLEGDGHWSQRLTLGSTIFDGNVTITKYTSGTGTTYKIGTTVKNSNEAQGSINWIDVKDSITNLNAVTLLGEGTSQGAALLFIDHE